MSHDPTKWPTPMHAWRYWFDRSKELEKKVYEIEEAYYDRYGPGMITNLRLGDDPQYKLASGQLRFAEQRVATYGLAVMIQMLELRAEQGRSE